MSGYRPMYTIDEDMQILNTIINTNYYYKVCGRAFWMDLSNMGIVDRTWQSLKERFDRHIIHRLDDARYTIPDFEKKKIKLAVYQLTAPPPPKPSGTDSDEDDDVSDESEDNSESDTAANRIH